MQALTDAALVYVAPLLLVALAQGLIWWAAVVAVPVLAVLIGIALIGPIHNTEQEAHRGTE